MKGILNSLLIISQGYVIIRLFMALRGDPRKTPFQDPIRGRLAIKSLIIVSMLEFSRTAYDYNGPGDHFPLSIGLIVLATQTVMMLIAIR